jgi:hypothetical protein
MPGHLHGPFVWFVDDLNRTCGAQGGGAAGAMNSAHPGERRDPARDAVGLIGGLTHIPGDSRRKGVLVASTDGAYRRDANVYLRPLDGGWFIYFQRDD